MLNDAGLSTQCEQWGCPMDDSTPWKQSDSGDSFTSPDGIGTAACWLPCLSGSNPVLPGMCASCELFSAGLTRTEPSRSIDGG
jgi:hypothetical protein